MSRPVRPQVRDEMPLSEPWPRHGPATGAVPEVGSGDLPDLGQVAEYPPVSSLELPMVVAADLLAVEGKASHEYRY